MLTASKDDMELLQSDTQLGDFKRSKSDPVMDTLLRVVQYDESDTEVCYKFYEEENSGALEYNYHDFSHSTWHDFTREKTPIPPTIEKHTCDDIRICLPIHAGLCYSLKRCVSGIVSGWGFTSKPREPYHYYLTEAMNGILCGMTMLPEVISFSFIAGIPIQVALHGSWILCLCATIFGGSPGIVTGVSGAFAAVAGQYSTVCSHGGDVIRHGPEYQMCLARMLLAVMLASILLLIFSFIHMASLSQFLSTSVIIGYSNGLALIIARAQLHGFQNFDTGEYLRGRELYISILYCIIAFLIVQFSNKIPRIGKYIPSALVAVVVVIIIHYGIVIQVAPEIKISTIGSVARLSRDTCIPQLFFTTYWDNLKVLKFDMELVKQVLTFTGSIMLEALIIADIVKTLGANEPNSNQQFFGLGIGNLFSSFLGSMGGSSMVGITIMNFKSGSKGKESSLSTALFIFAMMLGGYPMLNYIPIPSLCGIMFSVSCHCFKWFSIPMIICSALPQRVRSLHPRMKMKISRYDAIIILSVTLMCLFFIVPVAVFFGMVFAAFSYVWESKSKFKVEIYVDKEANIKYYEVEGNIFYASKRMLTRVFTPQEDPQTTVIVFLASTSLFDYTAIEALNSLKAEYASYNKSLLIKGLSHGCIKKVAKMNHLCRHMEHDLVKLATPNLPTLYTPFFKPHVSLSLIYWQFCRLTTILVTLNDTNTRHLHE
ncbi:sulfate transporter, putative [Theileria equi strain WA]|uniref:Sulfate transporter, putative n=1 Tax=Theileria equi strain WA TaxID=1537102 RepID=L0AW83_THEEQ|nr:sulfate transporter, putative [Theileria equi strain WA]AFZ79493.1 sulfate transporter, putative [Theileria equi strain WA]|eukprot:XP_004829159.1 sulfate transporter, putative [Theileria equi strain WA]